MPEPVPELTKDSYFAAQQAIRNVWYGRRNPILEGMEWAALKGHPDADEDEVIRALLFFAEQFEAAIDRLPANLPRLREKQLQRIQEGQIALQAEMSAATKQYLEQEAELRMMRARLSALRGQRSKLKKQLEQESSLIANVEAKGLRITVEAQPGYEAEVSRRQRQAIHEAIDEALGCNPSVPMAEVG